MSNRHSTSQPDVLWGVLQQAAAGLALIALSPVMIVVGLLIRIESRGPIVFRQRRPGWRGHEFTALKFRSMRDGSERSTRLGINAGDPRVTRVGRVLRATKLDELPQLWNICKGDMRFVGPRPIPLALDAMLRANVPGFEQRYSVRPGLTSLAQVCIGDNGLDDRLVSDWSLRFEAEKRYIRNRCVSYDLMVLALTGLYVMRKAVHR